MRLAILKRTVFALLAAGFLCAAPMSRAAWAQESTAPSTGPKIRGPLPLRDNEAINSLFLLPLPADASVLGKGKGRIDFNVNLVNNFLILPQVDYYTDFEDQRYTLSYSRGLGDDQEVSIFVPYVDRGGGILDGLINGWHKNFHMFGGGRAGFPNDQVVFRVYDAESGKFVVNTINGTSGLGDITLEYRRALTSGEPGRDRSGAVDPRHVSLTARALVKLPTGSSSKLLGSGATDVGLGIIASAKPFRRVAFHGNLSLVWNGKPENENLKSRSTSLHSLVAVEWLMDGRTSFLSQIDDNPAPNKTGTEYADRSRRMFTFGFWRQFGPRQNGYISLSENDFGWAARMAPDIQLSLGTRFAL